MIILPILLPLLFAIACLFAWGKTALQQIIALAGAAALSAASVILFAKVFQGGIMTMQAGNWPAPFGISLVIDLLSAVMLLISGLVSLAIAIYARTGIDAARARSGFFPLFFFLLMGVNGAFTTGDLFNLYVWFEVMLMASFVLIALGGGRNQIEGAVKYVILNLISSVLFLSAIGLIYNLTGTLNLADLAVRLVEVRPGGQVTLVAVLFLVAFGIKSAVFPLFFWLPASYHTAPVTVTALFSALLTKVGVYSLVRVFTLLFVQDTATTHLMILVIAALTMVIGVLGAAVQTDFRRLLSFHIVSQIGYLIMGLGLYSQEALAGTIYFMVHVVLAKTALFLIAGLVYQVQGSFDLKKLGGLYRRKPAISILFLFPALSLAGLPPLSGFFAKLILITAGLRMEAYWVVAAALGVSLLTLYSMTKIWLEVFWKEPKEPLAASDLKAASPWMWAPVVALVVLALVLGIFVEPALMVAQQSAAQLLNPASYVQAVFGGQP